MSDPKRLVESGALGGRLLASARTDAPSRRARERTAAALGVSVGVASLATGAVASGATAANAGGASAVAKAAVSATWMKFIAASALTVAVASGGIVVLEHSPATDPVRAPITQASAAKAVVAARNPARAVTATATADPAAPAPTTSEVAPVEIAIKSPPKRVVPTPVAPPESVGAATPETVTATPSPSSISASDSALKRELRSLDGARSALDRGDPEAAIAALDRHDREFGTGTLRTEASVLRIEALVARGDRSGAQKLARELLAREPAGAHARRLRSIVGEGIANP